MSGKPRLRALPLLLPNLSRPNPDTKERQSPPTQSTGIDFHELSVAPIDQTVPRATRVPETPLCREPDEATHRHFTFFTPPFSPLRHAVTPGKVTYRTAMAYSGLQDRVPPGDCCSVKLLQTCPAHLYIHAECVVEGSRCYAYCLCPTKARELVLTMSLLRANNSRGTVSSIM